MWPPNPTNVSLGYTQHKISIPKKMNYMPSKNNPKM